MRLRRFLFGLVVGLACVTPPARAILIDVGGTKVGGYFVRDDGRKLVIRVVTPDGQEKFNEYDRTKVKFDIVNQINRKRLEGLAKDNPKAYRDYATELAGEQGDPEARDMAMRLYLIAAYLDPKQFGHSALLSMSRLASTPAEERRCRAMAFLLSPEDDAGLLKGNTAKPVPRPKADVSALQDFLTALQDYRTGQIKAARALAVHTGVDKVFSMAPGRLDRKAFLQLCTDAACPICKTKGKVRCTACNGTGSVRNDFGGFQRCPTCNGQRVIACTGCDGTGYVPTLTDDVLRPLLRDELWAVEQLSGAGGDGKKAASAARWSSVLRARQVNPVSPLSLETITDFDPRKCLYRNGAWVAP
jgi:hypothetical protein